MSAWSRAPNDVKLAITTLRMASDERRRREHERPATRAEIIANIRMGFQTAAMILDDLRECRRCVRLSPLATTRWARDMMVEPDKLSLLAAQHADLERLLSALRSRDAHRTVVVEASAIYASLVSDLRLKQDEERRFLVRYREELDALRREMAIIKKLIAEIRAGRLDESDARSRRRDVFDRLTKAETRLIRLRESLLAEAGTLRKPKGPTGARKPLTPAEATKVAQRDEKRRDGLNDLQASRRETIMKKDWQIANVRARLGR